MLYAQTTASIHKSQSLLCFEQNAINISFNVLSFMYHVFDLLVTGLNFMIRNIVFKNGVA